MAKKGNHKDLPPEIKQVKEQIEKERFLYISGCKPSVEYHASHHQLLALIQSEAEYNNGRDNNNTLLSRMQKPLRHFIGSSSYDSDDDEGYSLDEDVTLQTVKLPFVEQLPRSITGVFTNRGDLMAESDSVIGKRQFYYLHGETVELSSEEGEEYDEDDDDEEETKKDNFEEEEETEKEKLEFSKAVDRFIWTIGQDYGLDDLVLQTILAKFLKVDVSKILERYNELKLEDGETSDLSSKRIFTTFKDAAYRRHCRRCLIFDCNMHETCQHEIKSRKGISNFSENEDDRRQCSEHCYLKARSVTEADHVVSDANTETEDGAVKDTNEVTTDITGMAMWTPVEKDLYLKGVEIFGRNSCIITSNVLSGLKTCLEVYNYMREHDQCTLLLEQNKTAETRNQVNKKVSRKGTKLSCRKARERKYARCPLALKKTANGEAKFYKHYTPCTCESTCGDQCLCLTNENCCEKYCGCSKSCNNRFGGCSCAIGQCINRQCPCFAANRECDPDLCRNCSLGCGEHETSEQMQCKNMQFLLKKKKKILIARSDVQGWGAFTRYALKKNEYLGEYTGELITHEEANERGRVEDRIGSSYLFTLNDQLEIDARRKGNKFKYLNHSAKPNCYAKLTIVRGDQRIGMFADKAIEEGEELFFDYCYGPDHAYWSRGRKPRKAAGVSKKSKKRPSR